MTVKVLAYGRVSTDKQEISPEVQQNQCSQWVSQQVAAGSVPADHQFDFICDKAVSGKVELFQRPQGQHILRTLKRGDILVVSKLSRAFRSTRDALKTVDTLNELGIRLVMLDVQVDTATPIGKMLLTVLAAFAELEREMISERTKEALRLRKLQGMHMGRPIPGYKLKPKRDCRGGMNDMVIDNDSRVIGTYIVKKIAEGVSPDAIANEINAWCRKNPQQSSIQRGGRLLSHKGVMEIACHCLLGWPKAHRDSLYETHGKKLFTMEFVRDLIAKQNQEQVQHPVA